MLCMLCATRVSLAQIVAICAPGQKFGILLIRGKEEIRCTSANAVEAVPNLREEHDRQDDLNHIHHLPATSAHSCQPAGFRPFTPLIKTLRILTMHCTAGFQHRCCGLRKLHNATSHLTGKIAMMCALYQAGEILPCPIQQSGISSYTQSAQRVVRLEEACTEYLQPPSISELNSKV